MGCTLKAFQAQPSQWNIISTLAASKKKKINLIIHKLTDWHIKSCAYTAAREFFWNLCLTCTLNHGQMKLSLNGGMPCAPPSPPPPPHTHLHLLWSGDISSWYRWIPKENSATLPHPLFPSLLLPFFPICKSWTSKLPQHTILKVYGKAHLLMLLTVWLLWAHNTRA